MNVINQVTELVRSENKEIGELSGANHHDYNLKKGQALVALNRLSPLFAHLESNPVLRAALQDMRRELESNLRLLELQLRAARAVSDLITRAICEGQSDGTYSALPWKNDT